MDARIAKYAKQQCCVCGKYGADEPFGEPLESLKNFARKNRMTLRLPESRAVHPKCFTKLRALYHWKRKAV